MDKSTVILIVAVFTALGFSLYRRYMKKNQGQSGGGSGSQSSSSFTSHSKDDDYEPYSKK